MMKKILLSAALLGSIATLNVAQAAVGWNLVSSNKCVSGACNSYGSSITYKGSDGTLVDTSAFVNTGSNYGGSLTQAEIRRLGGYGIIAKSPGESTSSPYHAIGNGKYDGSGKEYKKSNIDPGNFESILFDFGENNEVSLDTICLTWIGFDSDISVAAYQGNANPMVLNGSSYGSLLSSGWSDVAQLSNVQTGWANRATFNSSGIKSRYWLIGAYNPALDSASNGWSTGNDFFKLEYVGGDVFDCTPGTPGCGGGGDNGSVPVPGTLLLTSLGLLMGSYARRRKLKA